MTVRIGVAVNDRGAWSLSGGQDGRDDGADGGQSRGHNARPECDLTCDGGDGFIDLFVTGVKTYGLLGVQGSTGTTLALDGDNDSSFWHWSGGINYELFENFSP